MSPDQIGFQTLLKKEIMRFWVRRDLSNVQWTFDPPNAAPWMARPGCSYMDVTGDAL